MFKPTRTSIPTNPGVYIYRNNLNEIIYVGKAKNLRNRVMSYFTNDHKYSPKTQFLVKNIYDFEYIIVDNEVEALLLENKLIKKHKPKYNINLKDSKTYAYIKITDEKIPKIHSTRRVTNKGTYFGPYTDGILRYELIELVSKLFNIITPKTYTSKSKINYEIGIAPAKTLNEINKEEYNSNIKKAKDFLNNKNTREILKNLQEEMYQASENLEFEKANEKKQFIQTILKIQDKQKVDLQKNFDQDILTVILDEISNKFQIQILHISKGVISGKKEFFFNNDETKDELFESFVKMYYSKNTPPKEIIINLEYENSNEIELIELYLNKIRGSKVSIINPKKGEKKSLLDLAIKNAKLNLGSSNILEQVKIKLKLPKTPHVIECFDMSNLGYDYLVGAMTRWVDAKPDKSGYRKFEIKSFTGYNDDFAAMREVVHRRYKRLQEEKKEFPDLIIIDGGKGQLGMACEALKQLNLYKKIPIISLAKQDEEIYFPEKENPINLDNNSRVMLFIRDVRNSVHNYVVNFNRKKREMRFKDETK